MVSSEFSDACAVPQALATDYDTKHDLNYYLFRIYEKSKALPHYKEMLRELGKPSIIDGDTYFPEVLFVYSHPHHCDSKQGLPLTGRVRDVLTRWCLHSGIKTSCYLNLFPLLCRNGVKERDITPYELTFFSLEIRKIISWIQPRALVVLGKTTCSWFSQGFKYRKSFLFRGIPCFIMHSPQYYIKRGIKGTQDFYQSYTKLFGGDTHV